MKSRLGALLGLALAMGLYAQTPSANGLRVIGSNGIREVLNDAKTKAEAAAKIAVNADFGTSGGQVERIEKGADFDVVVLTSDAIDDLANKGKVVPGSKAMLARAGIGVGIRKGTPTPDIKSADGMKKALLAAKSVTYAQDGASRVWVEKMFAQLGIAQQMMPKIHLEQGSTKSAALVAQGKADMILTLISEILPVEGVQLVGPIPSDYQHYIEFAAGLSVMPKHAAEGKAYIQFLASPAVGSLLAGKGMEPPKSR